MQVLTIGRKSYVLIFINNYLWYTIIYLLSKKNKVCSKLKEYIKFTSNKFGKILEMLRRNNGDKYVYWEIPKRKWHSSLVDCTTLSPSKSCCRKEEQKFNQNDVNNTVQS